MDAWFESELVWRGTRNALRQLVPDAEEREGLLVRAALAGMGPLEYLESGLEEARLERDRRQQEEARVTMLASLAFRVPRGVC